jgi:RNA polymerase sigma-70 factor (ECF subfamily)
VAIGAQEIGLEAIEQHRGELAVHCYRMLGSAFEADDAAQETIVRAWRSLDSFEGRSSLRSWLYRIATNICLDQLRGRNRRARPMDLGPASSTAAFDGRQLADDAWVTPMPDARWTPPAGDPAEMAAVRESVRLAFVAALQHLPARQRAVLLLRDVLRWQAAEVAELLDSSVQSVNSALQRARATLAERPVDQDGLAPSVVPTEHQQLLTDYVEAFEAYDMDRFVQLLRDDVVMAMPPYDFWITGPAEVRRWMLGPGAGCLGSRLLPTTANGCPAFGQYRVDPAGGHAPWALHVLEITSGRITGLHAFVAAELFPLFGLPTHLD